MFYLCSSLTSLPNISIWNLSKAENLSYMFCNCFLLTSLPDISKWNTHEVNNIQSIFTSCELLRPYPNILEWIKTNTKLKFEDFAEIFNVTDKIMKTRLEQGIKNIIGFSLGAYIPIESSTIFIIDNAFRNIYALSLEANIIIDKNKYVNLSLDKEEEEEKEEEEDI